MWADEYSPALALLRRIFPPGLMRYLSARPRPAAAPSPGAGPSAVRRALPATASQEQPTGPAAGAAQLGQQQGPAASDPLHLRPAAAAAAQPAADPLQAPVQQLAPAHASAGAPQAQQQGAVLPGAGSEGEPNQRPPSPLAQRLLSHTSEKEQRECHGVLWCYACFAAEGLPHPRVPACAGMVSAQMQVREGIQEVTLPA